MSKRKHPGTRSDRPPSSASEQPPLPATNDPLPALGKTPEHLPSAAIRRLSYAALAAAIVVFLLHARYYWHYVNDDAYITFRYSRFWAMGRGPYFNTGEHVEGYTNFLLMLLLVPVIALAGQSMAAPFARCAGVLSGAAGILVAFALTRRLAREDTSDSPRSAIAGVVAAGLLALAPSYALNSTSGLETLTFGTFLIAGAYLGTLSVDRNRWMGSGLLFAAAVLTRPEGPLIFAVYFVVQALAGPSPLPDDHSPRGLAGFWRSPKVRRHLLPDALIVTGVFAAHLGFRLIAYDRQWLPNTFHAKSGGFLAVSAAGYVRQGALGPFLGALGAAAALAGWLLARGLRRKSLPVAVTGICGALLPLLTGADWMLGFRAVVPFLPLLAVVVAVGWCRLAESALKRWTKVGPAVALLLLPLCWFTQGDDRREYHDHTLMRARGYDVGHRAMAEWLRGQAARPGDTIALMDIGIVGYVCIDQHILDITGLTDRFIARSPGPFLLKEYDPAYILNRRPEFIVLVKSALGDPDRPLPSNARVFDGTPIEMRIRTHPDFTAHYLRQRPVTPDMSWTERFAAKIGAERVFEHKHPGIYYLLTVYKRHG